MTSSALRSATLTASLVSLLCACDPAATVAEQPVRPPSGHWQATITLPGGDIGTAFELSYDDGYQATLINGQERVSIDEVSFTDNELLLRFPVLNNEIRATFVEGRLQGRLTLIKRFGDTQEMPFHAQFGSERASEQPPAATGLDMSGRWSVHFQNKDGSYTPSIGEFAQRGSRLFGTFVNVDGDHRYLAGYVTGNEFQLSTFDGAHAFLFTGTVVDDAIDNGQFWSGSSRHQNWSATRNRDATLPDAYSQTRMKEGQDRLAFDFPDQEGRSVSLDDEKFSEKVVIVALSGSWCPNCNDEARLLTELHNEFHADGLQIVTLMFEHFDDHAIASEQVRRFRAKHSIEYDTLIAGISDKAHAAQQLPALDTVAAIPTTIFVDRDGKVRTIHTGFRGPGTGEYYDTLKSEFTSLVGELLAEPVTVAQTSSTPKE